MIPLLKVVRTPKIGMGLKTGTIVSIPTFAVGMALLFSVVKSQLDASPNARRTVVSTSTLNTSSYVRRAVVGPEGGRTVEFFGFVQFYF